MVKHRAEDLAVTVPPGQFRQRVNGIAFYMPLACLVALGSSICFSDERLMGDAVVIWHDHVPFRRVVVQDPGLVRRLCEEFAEAWPVSGAAEGSRPDPHRQLGSPPARAAIWRNGKIVAECHFPNQWSSLESLPAFKRDALTLLHGRMDLKNRGGDRHLIIMDRRDLYSVAKEAMRNNGPGGGDSRASDVDLIGKAVQGGDVHFSPRVSFGRSGGLFAVFDDKSQLLFTGKLEMDPHESVGDRKWAILGGAPTIESAAQVVGSRFFVAESEKLRGAVITRDGKQVVGVAERDSRILRSEIPLYEKNTARQRTVDGSKDPLVKNIARLHAHLWEPYFLLVGDSGNDVVVEVANDSPTKRNPAIAAVFQGENPRTPAGPIHVAHEAIRGISDAVYCGGISRDVAIACSSSRSVVVVHRNPGGDVQDVVLLRDDLDPEGKMAVDRGVGAPKGVSWNPTRKILCSHSVDGVSMWSWEDGKSRHIAAWPPSPGGKSDFANIASLAWSITGDALFVLDVSAESGRLFVVDVTAKPFTVRKLADSNTPGFDFLRAARQIAVDPETESIAVATSNWEIVFCSLQALPTLPARK